MSDDPVKALRDALTPVINMHAERIRVGEPNNQDRLLAAVLTHLPAVLDKAEVSQATNAAPIPMRLICPACTSLHIDEGEFATKPHHTHACQACGAVWRPAIVATVGVRFLPGFKNEPALRLFVRKSADPDSGLDYEMCSTCGKHIRHHYGHGAKSSAEYRCDPKDDVSARPWGDGAKP